MPVLEAHVAMIPRLAAEELLDALAVALIAAGRVKEADARRTVAAWRADAGGGPRTERPADRAAMVRGLGARGIGVRRAGRPQDALGGGRGGKATPEGGKAATRPRRPASDGTVG